MVTASRRSAPSAWRGKLIEGSAARPGVGRSSFESMTPSSLLSIHWSDGLVAARPLVKAGAVERGEAAGDRERPLAAVDAEAADPVLLVVGVARWKGTLADRLAVLRRPGCSGESASRPQAGADIVLAGKERALAGAALQEQPVAVALADLEAERDLEEPDRRHQQRDRPLAAGARQFERGLGGRRCAPSARERCCRRAPARRRRRSGPGSRLQPGAANQEPIFVQRVAGGCVDLVFRGLPKRQVGLDVTGQPDAQPGGAHRRRRLGRLLGQLVLQVLHGAAQVGGLRGADQGLRVQRGLRLFARRAQRRPRARPVQRRGRSPDPGVAVEEAAAPPAAAPETAPPALWVLKVLAMPAVTRLQSACPLWAAGESGLAPIAPTPSSPAPTAPATRSRVSLRLPVPSLASAAQHQPYHVPG